MKASDIIKQIAVERGIDSLGNGSMDLVPLTDLNVHKREVWNLSITNAPEKYFQGMDKKNKYKVGYYYKFSINTREEGVELCKQLSKDFGTPPCEMAISQNIVPGAALYLAIHIHPEFSFTPKRDKAVLHTQEVVLNFV